MVHLFTHSKTSTVIHMICPLLRVRGTEMKGLCTQITFTLTDMLPCDREGALGKIWMTYQGKPVSLEKVEKLFQWSWCLTWALKDEEQSVRQPRVKTSFQTKGKVCKYVQRVGAINFHAGLQIWGESVVPDNCPDRAAGESR